MTPPPNATLCLDSNDEFCEFWKDKVNWFEWMSDDSFYKRHCDVITSDNYIVIIIVCFCYKVCFGNDETFQEKLFVPYF